MSKMTNQRIKSIDELLKEAYNNFKELLNCYEELLRSSRDTYEHEIEKRIDILHTLKDFEEYLKSSEDSSSSNLEKHTFMRARSNLYKFFPMLVGDIPNGNVTPQLLNNLKELVSGEND